MATITVRRAQEADAAGICQVHVDAWRAAYRGIVPDAYLDGLDAAARLPRWTQQLRDEAANPQTDAHLVALRDGRVVGWARIGPLRDPDAGERAGCLELWAIYVHPDAWASGVGGALWAAMREVHPGSFAVWVLRDNARAIRFYESLGFCADHGPHGAKTIQISGAALDERRYLTR